MTETWVVGALIGSAVALLIVKLSSFERRLDRLAGQDAKLDALLAKAGIDFDAFANVPPAVREALDADQTILAIKRFREATGADLKGAKQFIDELKRRRAVL